MSSNATQSGFSLRNTATEIFSQFDDSFKACPTQYSSDAKGWVGEIDITADDSDEKVMTVSASIEFNTCTKQGKDSHYKCNFAIKEDNYQIKHQLFRSRTISIKDSDVKSKEKVIAKIKECRTELTKLLAEGKAEKASNTAKANKILESFGTEVDAIKAGLGDTLAEITADSSISCGDVSVSLVMKNGEKVYVSYNGEAFSLFVLNNRRLMTTDKLIALLGAVYA